MLNIYIANLGKYNEGELVGKWIELPCFEEDLQELFVNIKVAHYDENGEFVPSYTEDGIIYDEVAIHDFETDLDGLSISEFADIDELNELAERLESLQDYEVETIQALIEAEGCDISEALERLEKGDLCLYNVSDLAELAEHFFDEGMFSTETLLRYIDFERLGRDLSFDGYTETEKGVLYHG